MGACAAELDAWATGGAVAAAIAAAAAARGDDGSGKDDMIGGLETNAVRLWYNQLANLIM